MSREMASCRKRGTPQVWGVLCFLTLLGLPLCSSVWAETPTLEKPKAAKSTRLWKVQHLLEQDLGRSKIALPPEAKSFLLPGWGQFAQKRPVAGTLFALMEAAALTGVILATLDGNDAYRQYQEATTPEEAVRLRQKTLQADRNRNIAITSGIVIWGINLLDVSLAKKRRKKKDLSRELHTWR